MPTCKYFLEGLCTREDCVYLHVKISAKAEICKDFLEGYCKKAKEVSVVITSRWFNVTCLYISVLKATSVLMSGL